MESFNDEDALMFEDIESNPNAYTIIIDSDSVSVTKNDDKHFYYTFEESGCYFIFQLLRYLDLNAERA